MSTNSTNIQHPFEYLEAFALNALEAEEELAVTDHVDQCDTCSAIVEDALRVLTFLSETMSTATPSDELRARILDSIEPGAPAAQRVSVSRSQPPRSWARVTWVSRSRVIRYLTPATAVLAVVAIAVAMTLNVQLATQVGDVQSENTQLRRQLDESMATTSALARSSSAMSQVRGDLQRWQETSYVLAQPGNQTVVLTAARPEVDSKGVMILSEDGREAVLMASDLAQPQPDSVYHVWLTRGGQWYWAGELDIDDRGWGTMPLRSPDSLLQYDTVQISMGVGIAAARATPMGSTDRAQATASVVGDMVLVADLR